jgi:phage gp45-like
MSDIIQKMRNMIRIGRVVRPGADNKADCISQVESMGKAANCVMVYPFGISANAPANATVLMFATGASCQNMVGIPFMPENRVPGLEPGEVAFSNPLSKSRITAKADGTIETKCGTTTLTIQKDGSIRGETVGGFFELGASGQMNINGNFTVDPPVAP